MGNVKPKGQPIGRTPLTEPNRPLETFQMSNRDTSVTDLCKELGIKPVTLYRYVGPDGQLRDQGTRVLDRKA